MRAKSVEIRLIGRTRSAVNEASAMKHYTLNNQGRRKNRMEVNSDE